MRPPSKGSIQVSPTWSGHTPPGTRSRCAIGEKTAPGMARVAAAKSGGRGIALPQLREQRGVALAEGRVAERVAAPEQAVVAAALVPARRLARVDPRLGR